MDSERSRFWTIEKAQGAVKASFFSRIIVPRKGDEDLQLRFTQIQQLVSRTEGQIGDRTLSRALAGLVQSGVLQKKVEGKFSLYSLGPTNRSVRVKAFAHAEGAAIDSAGAIGGVGDVARGWGVYGVPDIFSRRLRGRLRKECLRHQESLGRVFDDVWDETIDSILRPVKGRVSGKAFKQGGKAIEELLELQTIGSLGWGYPFGSGRS